MGIAEKLIGVFLTCASILEVSFLVKPLIEKQVLLLGPIGSVRLFLNRACMLYLLSYEPLLSQPSIRRYGRAVNTCSQKQVFLLGVIPASAILGEISPGAFLRQ